MANIIIQRDIATAGSSAFTIPCFVYQQKEHKKAEASSHTYPTLWLHAPFFMTIGKFQSCFISSNKFLSWLLMHFKAGIIIFSDHFLLKCTEKPLCWFPGASSSSSVMLLLVCSPPLPAGGSTCYSFSVSLTSVWMEFIWPIPCSLHYFGDRQLLSGALIKT